MTTDSRQEAGAGAFITSTYRFMQSGREAEDETVG